MKIILDGNDSVMSCDDTDRLNTLVEEVADYLAGVGKRISSLTLDGTPVALEMIPPVPASTYDTLEIVTSMNDDMPAKMIVEIRESLERLKQAMMDTANKIQQGQTEEAMGLFGAVCEGNQTIHKAIITLASFKGISLEAVTIDGESGIQVLQLPIEFFREMDEAMNSKDYITVADILEFEIAPLFPRLEKLLDELAARL